MRHEWREVEPRPARAWLPNLESPVGPEGEPIIWDTYTIYQCRRCGRILLVETWDHWDPESGRTEDFDEGYAAAYKNGRNDSVNPEGCDPREVEVWQVMES